MRSVLLLAIVVSAAVACGPSGPSAPSATPTETPPTTGTPPPTSTPPTTGTPSGGGSGGGGSGGGGGAGAGPLPAPEIGSGIGTGGDTAWAKKMGGEGVELTRGVAADPDGTVIALNAIGLRGDGLEQIGLVRVDGAGRELSARAEDEGGARVRFPAGNALAVTPSGNLVVALTGNCSGDRCPSLGGRAMRGAGVASLSARGDLVWARDLPGEIATRLAVGPSGQLVVGSGGALHAISADGGRSWDQGVDGLAPGSPIALDSTGNVLWAHDGTVVKLGSDGSRTWEQVVSPTAAIVALAVGADGDVVIAGRATDAFELAGSRVAPAQGADHAWFVAALSSAGAPRWVRVVEAAEDAGAPGPKLFLATRSDGRIALVAGADACTATAAMLEPSGAAVWRRPLARGGCSGRALAVHGVAVTPAGDLVIGGALSSRVDLGTGPLPVQATDGFLVALTGGR